MAKRLMVLVGMLAVMLAAAVPALAQQFPPGTITVTGVLGDGGRSADGSGVFSITDEATGEGFVIERGGPVAQYVGERVELDAIPREPNAAGPRILDVIAFTPVRGGAPPVPPPGETATLAFELAVEGEPPEGTRFFGAPGEGGGQFFDADGNRLGPVPLTDPDGDGVYTGSTTLANPGTGPVVSLPVQIVQENGGNIEVIQDFGVVPVDGDETFEASVSFEDGQEPKPGDEVTTTGVLRESGDDCNECAKHAITDETSGKTYYLISDPQSPFGDYVDLDSYVDQRVTVSGILQMQGQDNLYVTSIEPVGGSGEEVTVTFELNIEGEVPEGRDFYLDSIPGGDAPDLIFCSTRPGVAGDAAPLCEDGETYGETRELPADEPFSYEYFTTGPDGREVFAAGTETFTEDDTVSATYDANDPTRCDRDFILGCGPEDVLTATFELTVTGEPPADATFFAAGVFDPRLMDAPPLVQLTDPDGNGVYTASQDTIPGDYQPRIVQGTGTKSCGEFGGTCPGEPSNTIKDFGTVTIEDDETFSASVSFKGNKGGTTTPDPGNGSPDNGGSGSGGPGGGNPGSGGIRGFLPSTGGGMALMILGVGALLVGGGLLVRRVAH